MKLTSIPLMRYGLYRIIKRRSIEPKGQYLPLYKSRVFTTSNLQENLKLQQPQQRYKQFMPIMLIAVNYIGYVQGIDFVKPKALVTELHFNPQTQTLKVLTLRCKGIITQQYHINRIIPQTYADMFSSGKFPQPTLPIFIDETMTYYNKFTDENYLFEFDGIWNQDTINHPQLSLDTRLNQKQWFDRRNTI